MIFLGVVRMFGFGNYVIRKGGSLPRWAKLEFHMAGKNRQPPNSLWQGIMGATYREGAHFLITNTIELLATAHTMDETSMRVVVKSLMGYGGVCFRGIYS